ncbi:hypothetical protein ACWEIJ_30110 [Lentzea sp. NPDC004789]
MPVDHTQTAFEAFQREIGDGTSLRGRGRLVAALGWDRCGKTSLLNRCAAWVRDQLGEENCHVLSFVDACQVSDDRAYREKTVFQSLIYELGYKELLSPQLREEMTEQLNSGELNLGYRHASRYVLMPKKAVAVILLPRTEIPLEMENYARWAHPNLLFLAESRQIGAVHAHWPRIESVHQSSTPIRLDVGPLALDDGWTFVQARDGDRTDAPHPFVAKETIREVIAARELSIGELHDLLYGMYQEILEKNAKPGSVGSSPMGEVTLLDLMKFYIRRLGSQR